MGAHDKIFIGILMIIVLVGSVSAFTCGDAVSYEGQNYNTVLIGEQCWFAENLDYDNGCMSITWSDSDVGSCSYYEGGPYANEGLLYQWSAAMDGTTTEGAQGICPSGWHIPTDAEWYTLESGFAIGTCDATRNNVFDCDPAGTTLKSGGSSGFDILFAGYRVYALWIGHGSSAYLWSSTEEGIYDDSFSRTFSGGTLVLRKSVDHCRGYSVRCLYNENITASTTPTITNFTSSETTNFSAVDVTNVTSMTLAIPNKGKIKFPSTHSINAENEDYDANIIIEDASISVNTSALDSTFNSSATLTFYSIDCNSPLVYYSETETTRYNILTEDNQCLAPRCTNIQCADNTLTVDVEHFSGYAVSGSVNLTIDADDPKFVLEDVKFTAVYMNLTGGFITGATCNISFADGSYIMDEQANHYNYTKAFAAAQIVDYNVTCSKTGYNTVFANDTAVINEIPIPEFSTITLGLGLIAVLIGLFVMRKKR